MFLFLLCLSLLFSSALLPSSAHIPHFHIFRFLLLLLLITHFLPFSTSPIFRTHLSFFPPFLKPLLLLLLFLVHPNPGVPSCPPHPHLTNSLTFSVCLPSLSVPLCSSSSFFSSFSSFSYSFFSSPSVPPFCFKYGTGSERNNMNLAVAIIATFSASFTTAAAGDNESSALTLAAAAKKKTQRRQQQQKQHLDKKNCRIIFIIRYTTATRCVI